MVTMTIPVKRFACVRCPVPGPPRSESVVWLVSVPPVRWFPSDRCIGFAVVMAQVRRPVPFRTRKLRPGRGDGTALERVWESSTPPHSFVGPSGRVPYGIPGRSFSYSPRGSRRAFRSGNPIFCFAGLPAGPRCLGFTEGFSCSRSARSVSDFQREFLLFHKDFW